jgi:DNA-binding FrmR family transcriptional regulator
MAEVVEGHIREHMVDPGRRRTAAESRAASELIEVVRRYVR